VGQLHLAGHSRAGDLLIDTHDQPVPDPVWELYRESRRVIGARPTLIEWDAELPSFARLYAEAEKARAIYEKIDEA